MSTASTSLQRELRKKAAFDLPEQEAYISLLRTVSLLSAPFERLFKRYGLTESIFNALRILRGGGERGKMCSEIADELVSRVPDVTRLVDRLEKAEFAIRIRTPQDRRAIFVRITRKGLDALARLEQPLLATHRETLGHMSKSQLLELCDLLLVARHSLPRPSAPPAPPAATARASRAGRAPRRVKSVPRRS